MKVYLATAGEYSDYRVVQAFARREDAEAYVLADDVEEFEVADGPIEVRSWHCLRWDPATPDAPATRRHAANPAEWDYRRDFDGRPKWTEHSWNSSQHGTFLNVQGWDLERVRKVYSEQRAQHIARKDMGLEAP